MAYSTAAGGNNTFIPTFDVEGGIISQFSRNPRDFSLNAYSQLRKVPLSVGRYLRIDPDQNTRILYGDDRENLWAEGQPRPTGVNNLSQFEFQPYTTKRYDYAFTLGQRTVIQTAWMIEQMEQSKVLQQAMTARTMKALGALNSATWGTNSGPVDGVAGGTPGTGVTLPSGQNWTNGTATSPNLKTSLLRAASVITKNVGAGINLKDLVLIVNPDTAIGMSTSPEIQQSFIQSQFALDQLTGADNVAGGGWGLPPRLYNGIRVVIEDAVRTSTAIGAATKTQGYIIPTGEAYLVCRPGGDAKSTVNFGDENSPVVSTLIGFFMEEM
jgi:hypothetical protein